MNEEPRAFDPAMIDSILVPGSAPPPARRIWLVRPSDMAKSTALPGLSESQRAWLETTGFKGAARRHVLIPDPSGGLLGVVLGLGEPQDLSPSEPPATLLGHLPPLLPPGDYTLAGRIEDAELAAVSWALGAYRFRSYKASAGEPSPRLALPDGVSRTRVVATLEAMTLGRDLINTPANDMGPAELEAAARAVAARHGATTRSVIGDALLAGNFPLIHAVGRASPRAPRLIDFTAGRADAPKVTLVGKGICFDTGGLDIKPSSAMLLMKKDMGGAATTLALAHMILAAGLDVRLRVLIAAAENSVAGNAFRPGDVIRSRAGRTVEIGNTDAEGRLVLADALALADEEAPDHLFTFATLTGAARVALGPEIVPFYCDDDELAGDLASCGDAMGDACWRMPLRTPYEGWLDSQVADMNNVSEGGFAGSIVAAIFLKRFVRTARRFAHFDMYGWRPQAKALGPRGGEAQVARAAFAALEKRFPAKRTS